MNSLSKLSALIGAVGIATLGIIAPAQAADGGEKPTVVLVHGAFDDGSGWNDIIPTLHAKGLKVVSVQNPLSSLADDVAATRRALDAQIGPVILVGHSWGGIVITEVGNHPRVKALVYVAAFAPSVGQSINDLTKDYPKASGLDHVIVDKEGFATMSFEGVAKHFAQDMPAAKQRLMASVQGPIRRQLRREGERGSLVCEALMVHRRGPGPHDPACAPTRQCQEDRGEDGSGRGKPRAPTLQTQGSDPGHPRRGRCGPSIRRGSHHGEPGVD